MILILPFLEQQTTYNAFDFGRFISHANNRGARSTSIDTLLCPSDSVSSQRVRYQPASSTEGADWARGNYACGGDLNVPSGVEASGEPLPDFAGEGLGPLASPPLPCRMSNAAVSFGFRVVATRALRAERPTRTSASNSELLGAVDDVGQAQCAVQAHRQPASSTEGADWARGNYCNEDSDDIEGCPNDDASREQRTLECMTCFFAGNSEQAAPRSRHPLGVLVATADASVHFVSDSIDRGVGPWNYGFSVWDRFCTPADGNALDLTRVFAP